MRLRRILRWLAHAGGQMQVTLKLEFKRAAVIAACQTICQSLLLHLIKQVRVVDSDCELIGNRVQQ